MTLVETLLNNKWLSVVEKTLDNGSKYVYSKSIWCNGEGVAILPYRRKNEEHQLQFLGRFEVCPAHSDEIELCSITGGMDCEGESPVFTAVRELKEEAGIIVTLEQMLYLGTVRPSKSSDTVTHLFAVDLDTGYMQEEAIGDGTLGEVGAYCEWVNTVDVMSAKDPLLHAIMMRLIGKGKLGLNYKECIGMNIQ